MPKLTNHIFSHRTPDDGRFSFDSEIHVSTDGEFSATVPEYLVPTLGQCRDTARGLHVLKLKVNHRAYAPSKSALLAYVQYAFAQFHQCEEIVDYVLCYDWFAEVSYYLRPDGSLCENGRAPGANHDHGGRWGEGRRRGNSGWGISASSPVEMFSVGLFATVYKRTVYRRSSGDTVIYKRQLHGSGMPDMPWADRLTSFCSVSPSQEPDRMEQMPVTEQAARFFFENMLALAELGRRFSNFFGDKENVIAAIEGRGPSLLGAGAPRIGSDQSPT